MVQVVLAFIVVAATAFYIPFRAPQTDVQAPAQTAPAAAAASVPPPPPLAVSEPTTETRAAPANVSAVPEPTVASVPVAANGMVASASAPVAKP